jgi:hypothetical protein
VNTAPWGSATIVIRPTGMSMGGSSTDPPSSRALDAVWSASPTQNVTRQPGVGSSCGTGSCPPPISSSPSVNVVRRICPSSSPAVHPSSSV